MKEAPLEAVSITNRAFKADPYSFFSRLRADRPVCRVPISRREEAFLVTRYADVSAVLRDHRLVKDPANAFTSREIARQPKPPKMLAPLTRNMLGLDDPEHARLKRLVQATFTPRRVERMQSDADAISTALLDELESRGRFDLVADYALKLPVTVISRLLGVPQCDQARFARWSHTLIQVGTPSLATLRAIPDILAFLRYLHRLITMKRRAPQDDLVSALVAAEEAGDTLSGDELMAMIAILLSAGHETTTNLISNGILALMQNPAQAGRLRSDSTSVETAVEELLRFAGPVEMATYRYAREAIEIAGFTIPRGGIVMGVIASANRDEQQFSCADQLDLRRSPNRHLTFGEGGHYCVGAALARMEGRIAFAHLVKRMPRLRLDVRCDQLRWRSGLILRGLTSMPVASG